MRVRERERERERSDQVTNIAPLGARRKSREGSPTPRAGKGRERLRERFGKGYLSTPLKRAR